MSHTLISFLGKGSPDRNKRYRRATYDFGNDNQITTEFFGLALTETVQPDHLLVLGTTGSMWDVLLESLALGDEHTEALLELIDAANADCTTQESLDALAPVVSQRLGLSVTLRLIPYGRDTAEQIEILRQLSKDLSPGDQATLDVTHGFRHLPMLAQLSALYLRTAANVAINGIFYGALEMTKDGVTPVMNLDGLLRIADWVGALGTFDKDGDYGVFSKLLENDLPPEVCTLLKEASFFEQTSRVGQARGKLRNFSSALDRESLDGIGGLFEPTLRERISWCNENRLYQRQQALAQQHLDRRDYFRTALFAFEAFITRQVQKQNAGNPDNHKVRDKVKKDYQDRNKELHPSPTQYQRYCLLRDLRNQLAHGNTSPRVEVQRALDNPAALHKALKSLIAELLPES